MSYPVKKDKKYIPKIAEFNEDNDTAVDETALSADFINLQRITPPAITGRSETSKIGIGKASKIGQLLKDPYHNKPKSYHNRAGSKKKSNILANYPVIKKEIDNIALKQQEKQINDSLIKPLTDKGIKVNNIRTIYRK